MFFFLMLSMCTWMTIGWYIVAGFLPLYAIPLSFGLFSLVVNGKILTLSRALRVVVGLLVLLLCWIGMSSFLANDSSRAIGTMLNYTAGLALLLISYHAIDSFEKIKKALFVYIILVSASLALALLQMTTGRFYPTTAYYEGGVTGFESMNYAFGKNFIPVFAISIALAVFVYQRRIVISTNWLWLLIISSSGIAISFSRSTQLGAAAILVLAVLTSRLWRIFWIGLVLLFGLALLIYSTPKWMMFFEDYFIHGSLVEASGGRISFWGAVWHIIVENPIWGVGAGNFKFVMPQYLSFEGALALRDTTVLTEGIRAHNVPMNLAAESGVPAMLLYMAFYTYVTFRAYRVSKSVSASTEAKIVAYAGFLYMVGYFVDMNFHNYGDENTIWLFCGMILAMDKMGADRQPDFVKPKFARPKSRPSIAGVYGGP